MKKPPTQSTSISKRAISQEQVARFFDEQRAIGYESSFIEGARDCTQDMDQLSGDGETEGATSILNEKKGGNQNNKASMEGLADKARTPALQIIPTDVEVARAFPMRKVWHPQDESLGAAPDRIETDPDEIAVDPYWPQFPEYAINEDFCANMDVTI